MPEKQDNSNDSALQNSNFKADNFDKEKETAAKEQNQSSNNNNKADEQEILKKQKETD